MTNPVSRPAARALRTIAIAATPLSLLAVGLPAAAHAAGPISAADRDFLAAVHTTAAYASSASQMAQAKASAGAVKTIGKKILEQDKQLDTLARTAATKLQSPFPSAAPPALAELESAPSDIFDLGYISKLRETDGTLLQLAATTRIYTRNDLVRDLAQRTTTTMAAQIPLLESSGLIDFAALPAPSPTASTAAAGGSGPKLSADMLDGARTRTGFMLPSVGVNLAVLGAAGLTALITAWRIMRGRRRHLGR